MVWIGRYAGWLAVVSVALAGCGGGSKSPPVTTRVKSPSAPVVRSADSATLPVSTNGPTVCTVYEAGYATQVVFASPTFDVRAECRAWARNPGEGYLWGYQPASRAAEPAQSRQLCFLEDSRGRVAARVIEATGFRSLSAAEAARGSSACMSLISFGWIEQATATHAPGARSPARRRRNGPR